MQMMVHLFNAKPLNNRKELTLAKQNMAKSQKCWAGQMKPAIKNDTRKDSIDMKFEKGPA